jgi:hypothetical protein
VLWRNEKALAARIPASQASYNARSEFRRLDLEIGVSECGNAKSASAGTEALFGK